MAVQKTSGTLLNASRRCITYTLTKRIEKKLDGNCIRMLRAILIKSWKQYPIKSICKGTYLPSLKALKSDEYNVQDSAGELKTKT